MKRRSFFGAFAGMCLAATALPQATCCAGRLDTMGNLAGDSFVTVPKEGVNWFVCQGWMISDVKDGRFQMKRTNPKLRS